MADKREMTIHYMDGSQMKLDFPVVSCPNIGHVRNKLTLPVGAWVALSTRGRSLTLI